MSQKIRRKGRFNEKLEMSNFSIVSFSWLHLKWSSIVRNLILNGICFLKLRLGLIKCKSERSYISQNYLVCKNEFACTVTGKTYKLRGKLCCASSYVIFLITCKLLKEQYVGSAFKDTFKSRIKVPTKCTNGNKVEDIEVQVIEYVQEGNYDLEGKLWCIDNPNFLLYHTEWIVYGTGIVQIEKTTGK